MRLGILMTAETPWPELVDLCRHAEATGWDSIWYGDHFMPPGGDLDAPVHESWTTLAALAVAVPRVRLGHMVSGNTYRHPALVAKMAATIDRVSGGRFVLGLGAGWQKNEHDAYGFPYHTKRGRLERLDETCRIVRSLLTSARTTFEGRFYRLADAPLEPKPIQKPLPLLIGTSGEAIGLRIVAEHADLWNGGVPLEAFRRKMKILDGHCAEIGRNPREIGRLAFVAIVPTESSPGDSSSWYAQEDAAAEGQDWELGMIRGDDETIRRGIQAYRELGLEELVTSDLTLGATIEARKSTMDRLVQLARQADAP